MKVNKAPEKIYLFENPITKEYDDRWLSKRSDVNDIEYVRKDAFTENLNEKRIAKYLYEKKGYPIDLNGNIPLFDETMKDVEKYLKYNNDQFIEKACTWLKDRAERFVVSTHVCYYDYKHAVEDFKTYMKGE